MLAGVVASRNDVSVRGESEFATGDPSEISSLTARWFKFDAKRLADGTVRGSYRYRGFRNNLAFEASGPVTCLAVRGRRAWLGGRIEQTNDPLVRGNDMWFQVVDQGRGADAGEPDRDERAPRRREALLQERAAAEVRGARRARAHRRPRLGLRAAPPP